MKQSTLQLMKETHSITLVYSGFFQGAKFNVTSTVSAGPAAGKLTDPSVGRGSPTEKQSVNTCSGILSQSPPGL